MTKIKIICGAYGYRPPDRPNTVQTVRAGDTCDVSDEEATRLISMGVAKFAIEDGVATPAVTHPVDGGGSNTPGEDGGVKTPEGILDGVDIQSLGVADILDIVEGHFTEESLSTMTNKALASLAADLGLDTSTCKVKADYVALLAAVELDMPDEDDDAGDGGPDLTGSDIVP